MLPLLGVSGPLDTLPVTTACPICQQTSCFTVYADPLTSGEWAACSACRFTGDIITVAAKCWKSTPETTLARVAQICGVPLPAITDDVVHDYAQFLQKGQDAEDFWASCQANNHTLDSVEMRKLRRSLKLSVFETTPLTDMVGTCELTRTMYRPIYVSLRGSVSNVAVVIPFYDVPGRICGFAVCRNREFRPRQWYYAPIYGKYRNAGIGFPQALLTPPNYRTGSARFLFTDQELALRMHMQHLREFSTIAPISLVWRDKLRSTWPAEWWQQAQTIIWGPDLLRSLQVAYGTTVRVAATPGLSAADFARQTHTTPLDKLVELQRAARPLTAAVNHFLEDKPDAEILGLLQQIGFPDLPAIADFAQGGSNSLRKRLGALLQAVEQSTTPTVTINSMQIAVHEDGWYLSRQNRRISEMVPIITHVSHGEAETWYRGTVRYRHNTYDFAGPAATLDQGLLSWLAKYLRDSHRLNMPTFWPLWDSRAVQVALALHTPVVESVTSSPGWNAETRQFGFRDFAITSTGEILDRPIGPLRAAPNLPRPGQLTRDHVRLMSRQTPEVPVAWAILAAVAANLIAPAVGRTPQPILVATRNAPDGPAMAGCLGCCHLDDTGWPQFPKSKDAGLRYLAHPGHQNTLLSLTVLQAIAAYAVIPSSLIHSSRIIPRPLITPGVIPHVLTSYLHDLCLRRLELPASTTTCREVYRDMADWFSRIGGTPPVVSALRTEETFTPRDALVVMVYELYRRKLLSGAVAEFDTDSPSPAAIVYTRYAGQSCVWISQNQFRDALYRQMLTPPDELRISQSLAANNALVAEIRYKSEQGWLVDRTWWDGQLQAWDKKICLESL